MQAFAAAHELDTEDLGPIAGIGSYDALDAFAEVRDIRRAKIHRSLGKRYVRWLEDIHGEWDESEAND